MNTLPIPHPVYTAIGIYNRDCDDPIPLDDNICLNILKALEECNDDVSFSINPKKANPEKTVYFNFFLGRECNDMV